MHCTILKVAEVRRHNWWNHPVHIMLTDEPEVGVLLSSFDVSTHRIAITKMGVVRGEGWTPITTAPIALKPNENTLARMKKIAERYRHGTV